MHDLVARASFGPKRGPASADPVSARLTAEFRQVPAESVERCVADTWARARHLGIGATADIVERVAREHLLALVNSAPRPRIRR
ncbi:hypothetical protein [Spongiactinospora sp. TRM90649]|uniref:three-helix bundle dimerization domain-containing protein n=1 Tax=Spongiactinospora sp. TRM90649 TaxID=3031114 RepID=UPI0023FA0475|nr:hypothetical protein [Spongiactinospora sp. TRM90649]MDF5755386.1 hypothetical protein [Spongiactinospora sp. TRM90649]